MHAVMSAQRDVRRRDTTGKCRKCRDGGGLKMNESGAREEEREMMSTWAGKDSSTSPSLFSAPTALCGILMGGGAQRCARGGTGKSKTNTQIVKKSPTKKHRRTQFVCVAEALTQKLKVSLTRALKNWSEALIIFNGAPSRGLFGNKNTLMRHKIILLLVGGLFLHLFCSIEKVCASGRTA